MEDDDDAWDLLPWRLQGSQDDNDDVELALAARPLVASLVVDKTIVVPQSSQGNMLAEA